MHIKNFLLALLIMLAFIFASSAVKTIADLAVKKIEVSCGEPTLPLDGLKPDQVIVVL